MTKDLFALRQCLSIQAYCHFRLGQFPEALSALQNAGDARPIPKLHLEAQLYYRMGRHGDAIRIYHELFKEHKVSTAVTSLQRCSS